MDLSTADQDTVLDTLDRRLVCALQVDGRAETGRIAEVLGVSARTVTRRLARMQQAGLLRVVRMPDVEDAAVGALLLRVRVLRGKVDTIAQALADRPDVPFVDVMLGGQEVGAVMLGDAGSRDRLLYGQLPATAAVTETTTHAVLHAFSDAGRWQAGYLDEAEVAALTPAAPTEPPADAPGRGPRSTRSTGPCSPASPSTPGSPTPPWRRPSARRNRPSAAGCTGSPQPVCSAPTPPSTHGCWAWPWTPTSGWTSRRAAWPRSVRRWPATPRCTGSSPPAARPT